MHQRSTNTYGECSAGHLGEMINVTLQAMDEECEAFRTSQGVSDKWMTKNDVNEIVILRRGAVKTICYRTDAGR